MLQVRDMRATIEWYLALGFVLRRTHEDEGAVDWALLSFGDGQVMFNAGGGPAAGDRRDVDLYVQTQDVDALFAQIQDRTRVREAPHDTFYGMRELTIQDPDGFWVTFAEPAREGLSSGGDDPPVRIPGRLRAVLDSRAREIEAMAARGEVAVLALDPSDGWKAALETQGWRGQSLFPMSERTRLSVSMVDEVAETWLAAPRPGTARVLAVFEDESLLINVTAIGYEVEPGST
ncbi:MAG: VOC family protein [Myxococcales bacterium]|nr:VOC family protein [Myxococcales bacterium]